MYFIDEFVDSDLIALNLFDESLGAHIGIVASTNASATCIAHEIGHLCGLKDIYDSHEYSTMSVSGPISHDRIKVDWGTNNVEGYYPSGLMQSDFITRLLMYGYDGFSTGDISRGDIYGLYYEYSFGNYSWHTNSAPIGFHTNGNRRPAHK